MPMAVSGGVAPRFKEMNVTWLLLNYEQNCGDCADAGQLA